MQKLSLTALVAANILCLAPGCVVGDDEEATGSPTSSPTSTPNTTSGDDTTGQPTTGQGPTGTTGDDTTGDNPTTGSGSTTTGGGTDSELCTRMGGMTGIGELVNGFVGVILLDDRINGYFLKNDLSAGLGQCVIDQLGEAVGCAGVVYGCKDMTTAHAGMGISQADFDDFVEDFVTAWTGHAANYPDLTADDLMTVGGALGGLAPMIIEDADNNVTVYQRVGRKPAIKALIGEPKAPTSFVGVVAADITINGFFTETDFVRLNTCLTRQVMSLEAGGVAQYGKEIDSPGAGIDEGVALDNPCKNMKDTHLGLVDTNDGIAIDTNDFFQLVMDLSIAMTTALIPMEDQNLIIGALAPLCPDIVAVDPENCP